MDSDFGSVTLVETKTESLFAVKNAGEKDATKNLVGEWLIKTQAFKQVINELIVQKKMEDVQTEGDIQAVLGTKRFLEKLLEIEAEDIVSTIVEGKPEFVQ